MRGQGSVEYLLTYSWAILVILVVLAVFTLIGLPNLRENEPERCHFTVGSVACEGFFIGNQPGGLGLAVKELEVSNHLNREIYVCGLVCSAKASPGIPTTPCGGSSPLTIAPGESRKIVSDWNLVYLGQRVSCHDGQGQSFTPAVSSLYRGKLYLRYSYEHERTGEAHVATGELVARVGRG